MTDSDSKKNNRDTGYSLPKVSVNPIVSIIYPNGDRRVLPIPEGEDPVLYLCGTILGTVESAHDRMNGLEKKQNDHFMAHKIAIWVLGTIAVICGIVGVIVEVCRGVF